MNTIKTMSDAVNIHYGGNATAETIITVLGPKNSSVDVLIITRPAKKGVDISIRKASLQDRRNHGI